jgi:arginyl-tRNA synthetase
MVEIKEVIAEAIRKASARLNIHTDRLPEILVERPKEKEHGDFSTNQALVLFRVLSKPGASGKKKDTSLPWKNPRDLAQALLGQINRDLPQVFSRIEVAGGGFINFFLKEELFYDNLVRILEEKGDYGRSGLGEDKRIQIEMVSVNPTGPLHVGHGRGAAFADTLANILEAAGFQVEREYYINDVGSQMENLGRSFQARYLEALGEKGKFPEHGYLGEYLSVIARQLRKQDGDKHREAQVEFFTQYAYSAIMQGIKEDLKHFGVKLDSWAKESDLHRTGKVKEAIENLRKQGYLYEKDEALWFAASRLGDEKDRVLRKRDGSLTYLASDIAYHKDKFKRKFDRLIDIWGADHHGYTERIRSAVTALGYPEEKLDILLYQLVSLSRGAKPIAMSTRKGEFVTLREVMDEVGKDALRYFFCMRSSSSHLDFDLELAKKESPENPVYYVEYAHARISSIFKKMPEKVAPKKPQVVNLRLLQSPEEKSILKLLVLFPDIVLLCARNYQVHTLPNYLMELAREFHTFYNRHRVLTEDRKLTQARLALVEATAIVLRNGLALLGIEAPQKM